MLVNDATLVLPDTVCCQIYSPSPPDAFDLISINCTITLSTFVSFSSSIPSLFVSSNTVPSIVLSVVFNTIFNPFDCDVSSSYLGLPSSPTTLPGAESLSIN